MMILLGLVLLICAFRCALFSNMVPAGPGTAACAAGSSASAPATAMAERVIFMGSVLLRAAFRLGPGHLGEGRQADKAVHVVHAEPVGFMRIRK
ncbi:hypothetical protein NB714_004694 [Pantoea dispersa]|nr:hypothetical protein [Pantoea dispersa]MCW0328569.1 hypothetical protein [Pantoea dispersa]MCW0434994.1 hypothetical protein [Pantoea dispersa]